MSSTRFRRIVWSFYKKHGRHDLPWRKTRDPYKILVSEVMLQQTQVERVIPYYKKFIKRYPTPQKLAAAPLSSVLGIWQGLGYNRRAKMLWQAAREINRGRFPKHAERLEQLPGIGPYTARAVMTFSYNQDAVFIETNIRTAVMHHYFPKKKKVSDAQILKVLKAVLPNGRAREWYSALMDYGAYLKKSGVKINAKSKHYTKQSKFAGSNREARGAILRELAKGPHTQIRATNLLGAQRVNQMHTALKALLAEHLIEKRGNLYRLPR